MERALHRDALDALGDPNRRAIADRLPISRPAVSRHLRMLKGAGLVADRPAGTRRIYQLRAEGVDAIRDYFAQTWDQAVARYRIVAENTSTNADER
jgi:DNA-binding transcriptional ArsR family regulator